ncbi:Phage-related protein, tail component [Moraxella catarrhalis 7169]|uniref:TipJ family phage tail tip protein n=1 Tax=Moraxella catarrhalis TaxID=480 RepID=UPI0002029FA7|nr:phage tail protein [Moraxella catarrhalis]EGE10455.1 Phage-related protein, tail component [Moraxella catarrhalis 7169]
MNIYGAKRQKQSSNKPYIQKDTASSTNSYQALYGLSEGEIYGLVDGGKSIRLDGTPIINDNGEPNFPDVSWDFRAGSIDQTHIKGFSSVENEQSVNVELRHDRPYTKAINNKQLSAVAIRLGFNSLREQKGNGDVVGYRIEYAIDVQTDGGAWEMVLNTAVDDKVSQGYQRSHRIDLPKAQQGWSVRVRRLTPNRDSEMVSDTMVVSAVTEIIDAKLRYPCTALLALKYDAQTFSNIAKVAVHVRGMLIQVPTNYDPTARTYDGLWDGTFKLAYTNNPAWVFYDICTAKRYGLGDRLAGKVDKWSLYRLAQYCDEMVDDGKGGKEPRFTVNVYLQKADDAYRVLQNLASVFRALSFWDGTSIVVDADTPKEPVYVFSNANVIGGEFSYTGTRARDRHTIVKCAYDDPDNNFETDYIYVQDEHAIAKYGINQLELNLFGCTSKGQAQRAGIWALKSEQLETETVSFSTGLDGFIPKVGEIIHVQDNHRAGRMQAGRIVATDGRQITLDRMAGKVGDTLMVGDNSAQIVQIDDTVITTDTAIGRAGQVFAISSSDVAPRAYRVMTISQNDDASFSFTALQYEIGKFTATNNIAAIPKKEVSVIKAHVLTPPNSVGITERTRTHQGQAITTLVISWEQVVGAVAYIVEYKKDSNAWQTHKVSSHSLEIDGVYAGVYQAKVRAIDAFDNESLATSSQLTQITGKQGKPPRPINLSVQGVLFGMNLGWNFAKGSGDTNYTEIQVSPDGRSNIATLGTFAYPTNKHEITGLQGNLTQFYRARIVDKLGNTSDWTDWASGTTSANADKVLDILSGQISQSHLDQSLRTPIGKIGTIESNISKINVDLPELNQSIADAQSTLNTAVASIDTEKKRLSSAIVDINTLKQSNNAKTQEIANLTQTVNGHTSQVRELGVTTGDLSQKYSQLKTTSDTANSEITAIKQTQSGQATSVERIRSELVGKASSADLQNIRQTLANADSSLSQRINTLQSDYNGNKAGVAVQLKTLSDKDNATASQISRLNSQIANKASSADLQSVQRTLTSKERSLSQRINTVQTTLNGQTASIQQHAQSLNGLLAQWTLKVQSGGVVSGIGLASNNGVSDFAVIADKFYVASPQGDKKPMFTVTTRPTTLNGTTVPAVVSLNGDLIGNGTISGDKIRANTQITAPNIRGGSINIGNNFSVDNQGNLNANSGVFRGQVFADKITGQIDVESLKSSAVALGYDTYISDNYHASEPHQFDKTFKASYPSHGSITQSLGFNNENIGSIMYEMRVFCKRAITVKQKLHTVDDKLYCYVNGSSAFGYHSVHNGYDDEDEIPLPFGRGRINTEISLPLRQGLNTIQFVLNNSGGGICQVILIGDFIDNNIIKFA